MTQNFWSLSVHLPFAGYVIYRCSSALYLHPTRAELRPLKHLASFSNYAESLARYPVFRALALLIWLLIAFVSVFTSSIPCTSGNTKFVRSSTLAPDQAQRFIRFTSGRDEKRAQYIAENRFNGGKRRHVVALRVMTKMVVPDFEPLFADSDCAAAMEARRGSLSRWLVLCVTGATAFQRRMILTPRFLIGSDNLCMANFGLP